MSQHFSPENLSPFSSGATLSENIRYLLIMNVYIQEDLTFADRAIPHPGTQ